jgi:hypothetical protein
VEGKDLSVEVGMGEPGLDAQLPVVVASRADQELAVELEAQVDRLLQGGRLSQIDKQLIVRVAERGPGPPRQSHS